MAAARREYKIISADSHTVEPPDLWDKWLDKKYLDTAPKLVDDGQVAGVHGGVEAVRRCLTVEEPPTQLGQCVAEGERVHGARVVAAEGEHGGIGSGPYGDPRRRNRPGVDAGRRRRPVHRGQCHAGDRQAAAHRSAR